MGLFGFADTFFHVLTLDRQRGILVIGKTETDFLMVSINNIPLWRTPPRVHLESRHLEDRWELQHVYSVHFKIKK